MTGPAEDDDRSRAEGDDPRRGRAALEPLFRRDGDLLIPGPFTRGPWYADALHGSAMLAAMAHAAEAHPSDVPRQVVRLTVDMVRAAPMAPLHTEVTTVRSGKSIDVLDLALMAEGEIHVHGRALRLRTADLAVAAEPEEGPVPTPPTEPSGVPLFDGRSAEEPPAFHDTIDIVVDGADGARGADARHAGLPTAWFRLKVPVIAGEPTSGFVAAATLCDWTYAVPMLAHRSRDGGAADHEAAAEGSPESINVDTTLGFLRPMDGEWLGIRVRSAYGDLGAGLSSGELFDQSGRLGFSTQSILVRGIRGAPVTIREV